MQQQPLSPSFTGVVPNSPPQLTFDGQIGNEIEQRFRKHSVNFVKSVFHPLLNSFDRCSNIPMVRQHCTTVFPNDFGRFLSGIEPQTQDVRQLIGQIKMQVILLIVGEVRNGKRFTAWDFVSRVRGDPNFNAAFRDIVDETVPVSITVTAPLSSTPLTGNGQVPNQETRILKLTKGHFYGIMHALGATKNVTVSMAGSEVLHSELLMDEDQTYIISSDDPLEVHNQAGMKYVATIQPWGMTERSGLVHVDFSDPDYRNGVASACKWLNVDLTGIVAEILRIGGDDITSEILDRGGFKSSFKI